MWYSPAPYHKAVSMMLSPISLLYGVVMYIRRVGAVRESFPVPIVSVGNIVVGGSGKTPAVIEIASRYEDVAVISRVYGRLSRGVVVVSLRGEIKCGVRESGDEAMLMASRLPRATVIVSEDRKRGIERAIEEGVKVIILDDGFNRVDIEKFEILMRPSGRVVGMVVPSGPNREFPSTASYADMVLTEGEDFERVVGCPECGGKMVLVTAIANPDRLEPYLPEGVVGRVHLPDHSWFEEERLSSIMEEYGCDSILMTEKDYVKASSFKLPISILKLELRFHTPIFEEIDRYIKEFDAEKNRNGTDPHRGTSVHKEI
jgi:tetraacyldisaccharide 4'-kinase